MLLQTCNFSSRHLQKKSDTFITPDAHFSITRKKIRVSPCFSFRCVSQLVCGSISLDDISDVWHNQVIVTAAVSAAIGQLSKPFISTMFYGKKFDFKAAIQAGGFPSTHSSAVVASATSLALERGFSDALFGLAVVYACLIIYDAQGVRREVGTHAKELNKVMLRSSSHSTSSRDNVGDLTKSFSREPPSNIDRINHFSLEEEASCQTKTTNSSLLVKSADRIQSTSFEKSSIAASNIKEGSESVAYRCSPLKESIGHTEIEVAAGALLGFIVSLALCPYT